MGLMSHLSCHSDTYSSYCVSFYFMTSLTMMVLGPGYLVRALFHFPLKILLVMSVEYCPLVMSVEYFKLVVSVEYFCWLCQWNIKSWSNRRIDSTIRIDLTIRMNSTIRIDSTPRIIFTLKIFIVSNSEF